MPQTIDVLAPQEQEGTQAVIRSWFKALGDEVAEGEPLVELETDKVAVEVPAPATGVLSEILLNPDESAEPGAVLGRLAERRAPVNAEPKNNGAREAAMMPAAARPLADPYPENGAAHTTEHRLSPSVRRMVRENDLDPTLVTGTGRNGRITREDVQAYLAGAARRAIPPAPSARNSTPAPQPTGHLVPHDAMRRRIAEHMSHSVTTAPHVTAVFEADFSAIMAHRAKHKAEFATHGVNLTYTAYIILACVQAMEAAPAVNSQWREDALEIFNDVHVGVGTALGDKGLIVPVIKDAQSLSLMGVAKELQRLTDAARAGRLTPSDVKGGTFSISNHGVSGSLIATPIIINQPQSAILGVGKLEKRVVVREVDGVDTIQIRPLSYVSLTIDHRALDGAQTNAWLNRFVEVIETWS